MSESPAIFHPLCDNTHTHTHYVFMCVYIYVVCRCSLRPLCERECPSQLLAHVLLIFFIFSPLFPWLFPLYDRSWPWQVVNNICCVPVRLAGSHHVAAVLQPMRFLVFTVCSCCWLSSGSLKTKFTSPSDVCIFIFMCASCLLVFLAPVKSSQSIRFTESIYSLYCLTESLPSCRLWTRNTS
jgi:hypothetical protein